MSATKDWATIVASSLDWEEAHAKFDNAVKDMPADLRAKKPKGTPHSVWDLVEHIRLAQRDLLDFCTNPKYEHKLKWPDDYWPKSAPSDADWKKSLDGYHKDLKAFAAFAVDHADSLTQKIPAGKGQTYLRTVLVAADHAAYHVGQIVMVRQLLGAWPSG